jgi:hypothetical protein
VRWTVEAAGGLLKSRARSKIFFEICGTFFAAVRHATRRFLHARGNRGAAMRRRQLW